MNQKFFTTTEVAEICQVNPASIVRWIHEGKITASFTAGGHFRVLPTEVIRLLQSLCMPVPRELQNISSAKRILIVDDEPDVRRFIRSYIERHFSGLLIEEAGDGFSAGTLLTSFLPDLVLLDLRMPGMDGFRVCKFIKRSPELKHTRIVVITGMADETLRDQVIQLGADDFLTKPLNGQDALKEKVAFYLELSKGHGCNHDEHS